MAAGAVGDYATFSHVQCTLLPISSISCVLKHTNSDSNIIYEATNKLSTLCYNSRNLEYRYPVQCKSIAMKFSMEYPDGL